MDIKSHIAKMLIIGGFFVYIMNYSLSLISFYDGQDTTFSLLVEDSEEQSESQEKENTEKEDFKEKDKITQDHYTNDDIVSIISKKPFHDLYVHNSLVYLEFNTPPPKIS